MSAVASTIADDHAALPNNYIAQAIEPGAPTNPGIEVRQAMCVALSASTGNVSTFYISAPSAYARSLPLASGFRWVISGYMQPPCPPQAHISDFE